MLLAADGLSAIGVALPRIARQASRRARRLTLLLPAELLGRTLFCVDARRAEERRSVGDGASVRGSGELRNEDSEDGWTMPRHYVHARPAVAAEHPIVRRCLDIVVALRAARARPSRKLSTNHATLGPRPTRRLRHSDITPEDPRRGRTPDVKAGCFRGLMPLTFGFSPFQRGNPSSLQ